MTESETIRGTVRRVHFCNPDGPWMSGKIETEDGALKGFAGKVAASVGDLIELSGKWTTHPKYGLQFDAETGLVRMDESPDALAHLLASDSRFQGLGPARARKVVDAALFLSTDGEVSSALIEFPQEVAERAGVSLEIVSNAAEVWGSKREHFDALARLVDQGWTNAQATKIVNRLGDNAPAMVKGDPYMLIGKIPRFGFRTVDAVALKMGTDKNDPNRTAAGVAYCLDRIADNGNTWTTRDALAAEAVEELRPDTLRAEELVHTTIEKMIQLGVIFADESPAGTELLADANIARIEVEVFTKLVAGLAAKVRPFGLDGERARAILPTLNEGQDAAVRGFSSHLVGVLSGGAGVGKTYTMRAVCEIAEENGLTVALCAPTGKAAKKLAHATTREAKTIHRTLVPKMDQDTGEFKFTRNASAPVEADLIVVDEVSMCDVRLMRSLLLAIGRGCRLLLVGDHNQIPSVGPGAILRDLLSARERYPDAVHVLTEIVRQAGTLARNTSAILDGVVVPTIDPAWGIQRTERGNEAGAAAMAAVFVESVVTSPEPLEPFGRPLDFAWDVQVLAPMRKGPLGTWALNVHLQKLRQRLLGNPEPEKTEANKAPKPLVGDRVLWTKNDYELDLFNGTQAIVMEFQKGGAMKLYTEDGRDVVVPAGKRINIEVAYAMTIHKSQGSEWPCVVLVGSSAHRIMHDRNLLYTGASRASESLTVLGDMAGLKCFAQERKSEQRQTLGSFLVHGWTPIGFALELPQPVAVEADSTTSADELAT